MENFSELKGLIKTNLKRVKMPKDAVCYVCKSPRNYCRLRKFNEFCLCEKHFHQVEKGGITDPTPRERKKQPEELSCCICGGLKMGTIDGKIYCRRHFIQMTRHGETKETIYSPNEWIDCGEYYECVLKDKNANEICRTKIDKEDKEKFKNYKMYARHQTNKWYAHISVLGTGRKISVHRFLMGLADVKYSIDQVVDHINGDSLDNRKSNLRICTQHQNAQNGRKKGKVMGVRYIASYNGTNVPKWAATIMHNYRTIYLGYYNTKPEAILARIKKEKEICGEYGPNRDLFYVLNLPSPIVELKKLFPEGV